MGMILWCFLKFELLITYPLFLRTFRISQKTCLFSRNAILIHVYYYDVPSNPSILRYIVYIVIKICSSTGTFIILQQFVPVKKSKFAFLHLSICLYWYFHTLWQNAINPIFQHRHKFVIRNLKSEEMTSRPENSLYTMFMLLSQFT